MSGQAFLDNSNCGDHVNDRRDRLRVGAGTDANNHANGYD